MKSNGLATILLMIPVLAVPALAIFGIPQFAPVVASPLDEGLEKDQEFRVGNSAAQSREEMFGDVEDFGSEPASRDEVSPKRRTLSASADRRGKRRLEEPASRAWGDDSDSDSDWPKKSQRPSSTLDADSAMRQEPQAAVKRSKKALVLDKSSRASSREPQGLKSEDAMRTASAADETNILQAAFVDSPGEKQEQGSSIGNRSRFGGSEGAKRREAQPDPLTWHAVQERLNELEIRSFRLEPGHQLGQFVFICSYTPPDNPRVSYRFEASADEPLKAVEKVLEQIVKWRQLR